VSRAGLRIDTLPAWLLLQVEADPSLQPDELSRARGLPVERVTAALAELRGGGLVEERPGQNGEVQLVPSDSGREVLRRLVAARRDRLREEVASLPPEATVDL